MSSLHEPTAVANPFVDAVVGLGSVCRSIDLLFAEDADAEVFASSVDLRDALLGICSFRIMIARIIAAMCEEGRSDTEVATAASAATWRRELLR